jgi:hypothetical protein
LKGADTVTKTELMALVKTNLKITGTEKDLIISDAIQETLNYCNLSEIPDALEPFIRKKVQTIINYELENDTGNVFDVKSIKEGDTSTTYNTDEVSRETVYGLSKEDKKRLQDFRRLRK